MSGQTVAALVLQVLSEVEEGRPAEKALEKALRQAPELTSKEREQVARRSLAVTCLKARLDHLLSASPVPEAERLGHRVAAYCLTEEDSPLNAAMEAGALGPSAAEALKRLRDRPPAWPADEVDRLAARRSFPKWLARYFLSQLDPVEADALGRVTNRPGPKVARANTLRNSREELLAALEQEQVAADPTPHSPWGVVLRGKVNVFGSQAWRDGRFEMQDEGSQLIALACAPRPGDTVVDYCAGSGGKTLALAAQMQDRGTLWATDVDARRLADLRPRLSRAGVACAQTRVLTPGQPPADLFDKAAVVLVDAPCSSLGTLRRGPDARWRVTEEQVAAFPAQQKAILLEAARLVRPGGRLVYATCTLNPAENAQVAETLLAQPGWAPLPLEQQWGPERSQALGASWQVTLWPHRHGTDGFYLAALQRT